MSASPLSCLLSCTCCAGVAPFPQQCGLALHAPFWKKENVPSVLEQSSPTGANKADLSFLCCFRAAFSRQTSRWEATQSLLQWLLPWSLLIQETLERVHTNLSTSPREFCVGHNLSYLPPASSSVAFPRSFSKKIKAQVHLSFTRIKWCMFWKLTLPLLSPLMPVAQKWHMVSQDFFNIFF